MGDQTEKLYQRIAKLEGRIKELAEAMMIEPNHAAMLRRINMITGYEERDSARIVAAIKRQTVEAPDDEPNGPTEAAYERLLLATAPGRSNPIEVAHAAEALGDAMADDCRELRGAAEEFFGGNFRAQRPPEPQPARRCGTCDHWDPELETCQNPNGVIRSYMPPDDCCDSWLGSTTPDPQPAITNLGADEPWPLRSVLLRLAEAGDHLLHDHDCDGHGHEEVLVAVGRAREFVAQLGSAPQPAAGTSMPSAEDMEYAKWRVRQPDVQAALDEIESREQPAAGEVPGCVERWRQEHSSLRADTIRRLRSKGNDGSAYHKAADCLEYLATTPQKRLVEDMSEEALCGDPGEVNRLEGAIRALRDLARDMRSKS